MSRFHCRRGKLGATRDLLSETACDVAADERTDGSPDCAVIDRLFDVGELGVEPLGITDREFDPVLAGQGDKLIGFMELDGNRFFQKYMLTGEQTLASYNFV